MDGSPYSHGHKHQQHQLIRGTNLITWGCSSGLDQNMVSMEEGHHDHTSSHIISHDHQQQQQHELNHLSNFDYHSAWTSDFNNIYHPAFGLQTSSHHTISPPSSSSLLVVGSVGHQVGLASHHQHQHQQQQLSSDNHHRLQSRHHYYHEEEDEEIEDHQQRKLIVGGDHEGEGAEEEDEVEEELGAMKEMMYKIAAMQPVDIDPSTIRKPKRRNVRISDDPQSVAARHRRERISEKMRILQRLVPGGTKMDTSSMLDEAIRYVKFLKRQIKRLQLDQYNNDSLPQLPPRPSSEEAIARAAAATSNKQQQCIKYMSAVSGAATTKTTTSLGLLHHHDQQTADNSLDLLNSTSNVQAF